MAMAGATILRNSAPTFTVLGTGPSMITVMTAPGAFGTLVLNLFLAAKSATDSLAQLGSLFEGRIVIAYVISKLGSALDQVFVPECRYAFAGPACNSNRTLQAASNLVLCVLVHLLEIALGAFCNSSSPIEATATYDPTIIGGGCNTACIA